MKTSRNSFTPKAQGQSLNPVHIIFSSTMKVTPSALFSSLLLVPQPFPGYFCKNPFFERSSITAIIAHNLPSLVDHFVELCQHPLVPKLIWVMEHVVVTANIVDTFADIFLKASTNKSQMEEENEEEEAAVFHFWILSSVPSFAMLWLEHFAALDNNNYFSWCVTTYWWHNFSLNFFQNILKKQGVCLLMESIKSMPVWATYSLLQDQGHICTFVEDVEEVFLQALEMRKDANHGPTGLTFKHPQPFQSRGCLAHAVHLKQMSPLY